MNKELEEQIIDKFQYMFALRFSKNIIYPISFGFECGDGWFHPIQEAIREIAKIDTKQEARVFQIKEKFGKLRIYMEDYPKDKYEDVINIITKAEEKCAKLCERCGESGVLRTGGWLATLCDVHAKK